MNYPPELIAIVRKRNPYATEEQIIALLNKLGGNQGKDTGEQIRDAAINNAAGAAASEAINALTSTPDITNEAGDVIVEGEPGYGNLVGPAVATYNIYDIAKNDRLTREQQAQNAIKEAGMAAANYATGGLAGLARLLASLTGAGRSFERKATDYMFRDPTKKRFWKDPTNLPAIKNIPFLQNLPIAAMMPMVPGLGQLGIAANVLSKSGAFGGLGTKEKQQQRAAELMNMGVTGYPEFYGLTKLDWDLYKEKFKDQLEGARYARKDLAPDFVGMDEVSGHWINNAYANTGDMSTLRPEDVWGQEGVFKTFGNDWLGKYTEDQRRKIAEALLAKGLFRSDHGDLVIDDKDTALAIRDEVLGGPQGEPQFGQPSEEEQREAEDMAEEQVGTNQDPNASNVQTGTGQTNQITSNAAAAVSEALNRLNGDGSGGQTNFKPLPHSDIVVDPSKPWGRYQQDEEARRQGLK